MNGSQDAVIALLTTPATHGGQEPVTQIETHAAIVFLVGTRAYKMKKDVRYPYLDYSTLALRRTAVEREMAVNRPNAPQIYLGIIAVTREADGTLALGGKGEPMEWLVVMARFDENATLDHLAKAGPFAASLVDDLALAVVAAERRASRREASPWLADLDSYIADNARVFLTLPALFPPDQVHRLTQAARAWLARIHDLIVERGRLGLIRLTHGDLHAGNIAVLDGMPVLFDAIEFDDAIATGDVWYDSGFLIMDLGERCQPAAANRLLGRLLLEAARASVRSIDGIPARTQAVETILIREAAALAALPFYLMLRAAIRAKVTVAKLANLEPGSEEAAQAEADARRYFDLAQRDLERSTPKLVAIGGLSGTGKSTLAAHLAPMLGRVPGALHLRTDQLRKLVFGVAETQRLPPEAYDKQAVTAIYRLLMAVAHAALSAGWSVIIDSVAARADERLAMAALAASVESDFIGLWLEAPATTLTARVDGRTGDASDADASVVRQQLNYDTGPIDWIRIDAGGTADQTLARATAALAR